MRKLKNSIFLVTVALALFLGCSLMAASLGTYEGVLDEIVPNSLTTYVKFGDGFFADVKWIIAPGSFVKGPIFNKKGEKIRHGDLLVACDPHYYKALIDVADGDVDASKGELKDARIDYQRQKKLALTKSISEKSRDEAEADLYKAVGSYKKALAEYELAKINLDYTRIEAPFDGFVSNVYTRRGAWSNIDYPVLKLIRLSPLWVDVKMDRLTAKKVVAQKVGVKIIIPETGEEKGVYNNRIILSSTGIKVPVDNYILPVDDKIDGKRAIVISDLFPVVRFDQTYQESSNLSVQDKCIFKDDNGYYVWRAVGQKAMQPAGILAAKFKVEKVSVVPANQFRESISGYMQKLKSPGKLQQYDLLLGDEHKGIKDGEEVLYKKMRPLFWPGDKVKVVLE
jgi:multidrug efflux pump subunit AcrA (membrane-fusion protein)